jgi:ADP-heptose:LPS heptosyltransferase
MFKDYSITLCGNESWRDLAETFDSTIVSNFIWVNRKNFYLNLCYKYKILKKIYQCGFEVAIDSAYNREVLYSDIIIKASNAKTKIGSKGSFDKHAYWKRRFFSDSFYDILIDQTRENLFEFNRNKEFFEKVIQEKIFLEKPEIDLTGFKCSIVLPDNYVVVFPGSNDVKRRWKTRNYAEICRYFIFECNIPVVIPVALNEKFLVDDIRKQVVHNNLIDLSGKATLSELASIIHGCKLVVSNDTSAVHFAAALNKKFLCITSGFYYGRFLPYPESVFSGAECIYPVEINEILLKEPTTINEVRSHFKYDINTITVERVKEKIKEILGNKAE